MLGNSEAAVRKLLESVFNALFSEEASEQVGAEPYDKYRDLILTFPIFYVILSINTNGIDRLGEFSLGVVGMAR